MNKKIYKKLVESKNYLYHITEFENLQSILKTGLLSLKNVNEKKIKSKFISSEVSRKKDKEKNIDKYVRLAYTIQYDMICREIGAKNLKNPAILFIDPIILLEREDIRYTKMNALKEGAVIYKKEDEFSIDFDKIFERRGYSNCSNPFYKDARQSEVLVENIIDLKYIEAIMIDGINIIDDLEECDIEIVIGDVKKIITEMAR
ncbi:MAG: DarT ssDNA thymidine ADP-ribosyltransferase family protein [Cetobacterium sp.]